ncbi:protein PET100 homolog, mitochondrial isoform X2 [Hemicordylus capensis]|uniref:protein PET100 homolog, mitochondrial isoform X2 n=1 Tax=Hemicordylus capensis TaxID=884348 RepID=UPI002302FC8A|nr:protein PET100 homolog, mitochondrial isoform X2 [Hemicordylus capensis]
MGREGGRLLLLAGETRQSWHQPSGAMGVKLEVFRMMLYLSFPVAMFWISNQAEYFEEYVIKRKREIYPPEDEYVRKELEDFKERMRKMQEERLLKEAKD